MRYSKDSSAFFNPRQFYWEDLHITQRRYLTRPFSFVNFRKPMLITLVSKHAVAFFYHWNRLLESASLYLPKNKRLVFSPHWLVVSAGFVLGSALHALDTRLWIEKKWDSDPGLMMPMRKSFLKRMINHYFFKKWNMFLYYHGLFLNRMDLDMAFELEQVNQGRMYRKTLAMEYAYKQKKMKLRDDRYDFLDFSAQHGQNIS